MENIILTKELITRDSQVHFGYVGRSLETGKMKHYFFPNKGDKNSLQEFDIQNVSDEYLATCLSNCDIERSRISSLLPEEIVELLFEIIDGHTKFNEDNGYPTNWINRNKAGLSIQPKKSGGLRRTRSSDMQYDALQNAVELGITKSEWKTLSDSEKEKQKNHLIHKAGHLKVTRCFLAGKVLNIQTGFSLWQHYTSPIRLENGDVLHIVGKLAPKTFTQTIRETALEEILNDCDCRLAFPSFHGNYPIVGEQLNNLCDGKLLLGRYTDGLKTYYDGLCSIIPDSDLANELLETIYAAIYGTSRDTTEEMAKQLIKRYESKKF